MAERISEEEFLELKEAQEGSSKPMGARQISQEEFEQLSMGRGGIAGSNQDISFGDYLKTVPATAVDIALGAGEGFAAGIGTFTGDYDLARSIGGFREDVNDAIMGDVPDELQSDFAYKIASGLGSTIPYLGAAILSRGASLRVQAASGAFYLSSAGQQVRDDYLGTKGLTSETASDAEMLESTKAGAIGAIPIALAERLGAGAILRPFTRGAIPAGQVMGRIKAYASAGASEALTEATQSGIINSIAGYVSKYDPDRPITQGMMESALIGFIVGGGVNAGIDTVSRKITQADRLKAGVVNEDINPADVIDPDVGSPLTQIAMDNDAIPESNTSQQNRITNPQGAREFISKTLTPISRRLGRAGKEIVREFRNYERRTGVKTKELKERIADFQTSIQKLKKTSPEDYRVLSRALANANELSTSLPNSVERDLAKKAQIQPEVTRSSSEQFLDENNSESTLINQQIEQARNAFSSMGLKTKVEITEEGESYYDPSSNLIVISAEQADGSTVGHEFFHAAIGQAVKTDAELQSMTRNMFDSVIRASVDGSSLKEQLQGFVSQYDENIQNEEFLAQTVGELSRQFQTLDINTKTRIKIWINQAMKVIGMDGVFKQAETDAEVIQQLNAFARFAGDTEALTERIQPNALSEPDNYLTQPIRARKLSLKDLTLAPEVTFSSKPNSLSLVKDGIHKGVGKVDIINLINRAIEEDATITFWGADQFGMGKWTDPVTGKSVNIDGGVSYPLSPMGGKAVWATVKSKSELNKLMQSDYVFLYSGKPETMHTFNSAVRTAVESRIESQYEGNKNWRKAFADDFVKIKDESRRGYKVSKLEEEVKLFGDNQLNDMSFTDSGMFVKGLYKLLDQKNENLKKFLNRMLPDLDSMRDGFLKENGFDYMDIYGVFKPSSVLEGKSGHGTYGNAIMGDVIETIDGKDVRFAIPDRVIGLKDILNDETMSEIEMTAMKEDRRVAESTFTGGAAGTKTRSASEFRKTTPEQIAEASKRSRKSQKVGGNQAFKKWFGDGKLKFDNGEPMVLYHGSKQDDITSFKSARSEGLIFFSTNPEFAEKWVRGTGGIRDRKSPAGIKQREKRRAREREEDKAWERSVDWNRVQREEETTAGGVSPYYEEMYEKHPRKSRMSDSVIDTAIYPVYLNSKKIFDPRVDFQMAEDFVLEQAQKTGIQSEVDATNELIRQGRYRVGNWTVYENKPMVDFLKTKGYDTMLLSEEASAKGSDAEHETLAVFDSSMIKSATANSGEYSSTTKDIRYQKERPERSASDIERARGLSDQGLRILEKHGMVNSYRNVRGVLDQLKDEYQALGLDMNFIDNYFPRAMKDLEGFKKSIGQTVGIDEEIRRYENMTGQTMTPIERQKMYERLARSRLYRSGGVPMPSNLKERRNEEITEDQLKFYASAESALDEYVERMVQTIETKKLIGDAQSGKTRGKEEIAGTLGQAMEKLAGQGRLRQDQIDVVKGAVAARFGQHGRQYGFVKGMKNAGYLATMGNTGSTLTQLGDFYFTMVQNGLIPTIRAVVGSKALTIEDLGIAKDLVTIETKDGKGFLGKSVDTVFSITGLTAMDRLAKNTNINAAHRVLTKGAKSKQGSRAYEKTLARLKRTQGNDAYKTIADLQSGKKSDLVVEALYNELADVAPISLTEMPENYAANPNLRILYSLKSYTIKQFNFVRERSFSQIVEGIREGNANKVADGSVQLVRIMAFGALANGSADVLKAILFNREIDEEDFWWNHVLRLFGVTKYTYTSARKEGVGQALLKTVVPPQFSMIDNVFRDIGDAKSDEGLKLQEMRSMKYMPVAGKLYYWREGRGVEVEERLSRLK